MIKNSERALSKYSIGVFSAGREHVWWSLAGPPCRKVYACAFGHFSFASIMIRVCLEKS